MAQEGLEVTETLRSSPANSPRGGVSLCLRKILPFPRVLPQVQRLLRPTCALDLTTPIPSMLSVLQARHQRKPCTSKDAAGVNSPALPRPSLTRVAVREHLWVTTKGYSCVRHGEKDAQTQVGQVCNCSSVLMCIAGGAVGQMQEEMHAAPVTS